MINHKHKFIFIHIPKCGGTSIQQLLRSPDFTGYGWDQKYKIWKQHCTIQQMKEVCGIELDQYYSFTFTRNPWARVVSDHHFWQTPGNQIGKLLKNTTIKDYLLCINGYQEINHLNNINGRGDHFRSQYEYIEDKNGKPIIDFIGKVENYQEDFNIVCNKIGIPQQKLPHINRSKHKHYTEYYDDETREIVAKKYAKDIQYFGYKFGE